MVRSPWGRRIWMRYWLTSTIKRSLIERGRPRTSIGHFSRNTGCHTTNDMSGTDRWNGLSALDDSRSVTWGVAPGWYCIRALPLQLPLPPLGTQQATLAKTGDCLKELDETACWLELLAESSIVPKVKLADLRDECDHSSRPSPPSQRKRRLILHDSSS